MITESDNKIMNLFDKLNNSIWKILAEKRIAMPQIIYVPGNDEDEKGSCCVDTIKIFKDSHEDMKDLLNTLIHELAHYYMGKSFKHGGEWQDCFIKILEENSVWKGISPSWIPCADSVYFEVKE